MNIDILHQLFLFNTLSDQELKTLLDAASIRQYAPGTVIFREGDTSDHFLVILEGSIDIVKSMDSAIERQIKTVGINDFLGEMSIISEERSRTASARTRTGVRVLEIPVKDLEDLIRSNPRLCFDVMRVLVRRMRETESITIQDLRLKNDQLIQSLKELEEAQAQLIAKEKIEAELSTARRIQQSMLPASLPALTGWELSAHWQPARAVSGDFYDFLSLPDGRLAIIVGDVTDKGVPAALIMTVTVSMLRAAAAHASSPGALLARVNNLLSAEVPMGMFVTCHVSFLDPSSGEIQMASAGHVRPVLRHGTEVGEAPLHGLALGIYEGRSYENFNTRLAPGDHMLIYSDGLFEAHDPNGVMFGIPKILDVVARSDQNLKNNLLLQLQNFTGSDLEPEDDITLVCLFASER